MSSARLSGQFLVSLEFLQRIAIRTTGITKQIKTEESSASCGGAECPRTLHETRHCSRALPVMAIHRDIAESVLGLPGVFAAQKSADNRDHKAEK